MKTPPSDLSVSSKSTPAQLTCQQQFSAKPFSPLVSKSSISEQTECTSVRPYLVNTYVAT